MNYLAPILYASGTVDSLILHRELSVYENCGALSIHKANEGFFGWRGGRTKRIKKAAEAGLGMLEDLVSPFFQEPFGVIKDIIEELYFLNPSVVKSLPSPYVESSGFFQGEPVDSGEFWINRGVYVVVKGPTEYLIMVTKHELGHCAHYLLCEQNIFPYSYDDYDEQMQEVFAFLAQSHKAGINRRISFLNEPHKTAFEIVAKLWGIRNFRLMALHEQFLEIARYSSSRNLMHSLS